MSTCAVIALSLVVLAGCIAGIVALARFIDRTVARQCEDDPYGM